MPNKILLKRSSTANATPAAGSGSNQVDVGELAINTADGRLFTNVGGSAVNVAVTSIAGQSISPSSVSVGTTTRVNIASTGAFINASVSGSSGSETNPRWFIGRDTLGTNLAGLAFGPGTTTLASSGMAVGYAAAREMGFYTSDATSLVERMRITGSGTVGIGTNSPNGTLEVMRANDSGVICRFGNVGGNGFDFSRNLSTGEFSIQGNQTGFNNIAIAPTSGNVGIGVTAPGSRLVVKGSGTTSAANALNVTNSADATLFTVRNDGLSSFIGQIANTRANSATTGAGQIYLNGATGNRIDFNQNGVDIPTTTTRSVGTKICLYPNLSATNVDYAIGIASGTFWQSVPTTLDVFNWFAGPNVIASLYASGFSAETINANSMVSGTYFRVNGTAAADVSPLAALDFWNTYDPFSEGAGGVGPLASIYTSSTAVPTTGCMILRAAVDVSGVPTLNNVVGVHSDGVIIKPPNTLDTPTATLDVRGTANITGAATVQDTLTVQGALTVQGGLRSPGEMLYLWSNFR